MRIRYLFLLLLPLSANAFANDDYISPDSLPPTLLTPPLSPHSQAWEDEISQMIVLQKTVTQADKELITGEIHFGPGVFMAAAPNWDREHYPATFHLLDKVNHTCEDVVDRDKNFWHTIRPYLSDSRIVTLAGDVKNGSYPSGHTACTRAMAEALGQVLPDKLGLLRDRANEIAQHRILAGVHYPHDIKGGEQLAMIIMGALQESVEYQMDLKAAQKEFGH